MRFEVLKRGEIGRIGELDFGNGKKISTPNILWIHTNRIKSPDFASLLLKKEKIKSKKSNFEIPIPHSFSYPMSLPREIHELVAEWNKERAKECYIVEGVPDTIADAVNGVDSTIFILANAREIFSNSRNFVETIVNLREAIGYQKLIYTPGLGEPSSIPLLVYMGIDLLDSIPSIQNARKNFFLTSRGKMYLMEDFNSLLQQNYLAAWNELMIVRDAIRTRRLREIVESVTDPKLMEILRLLDKEHYDFQEKRFPMIGKKISCASRESLYRPDVERFRRRIKERYEKPRSAKILLLLPCSAKKPYSFSKSHRFFRKAISNCGNPFAIHEMMITSPLGIVPRELEIVYPAAHYDVPVTGYWDLDEQRMVNELLEAFIENNHYEMMMAHLPQEIYEFLSIDAVKTCVGHPTSSKSIKKLLNALKITSDFEKVARSKRMKDDMESFLSYQFGKEVADLMMKNCDIKGRYPYQKIMDGKKQIGMLVKERGMVSLTLEGGKRLARSNKYWVEIEDFFPKGSVFTVGIKDADDQIRMGDEVVVVHDREVRGVGMAMMNADEMIESNRGEAVKLRHHL